MSGKEDEGALEFDAAASLLPTAGGPARPPSTNTDASRAPAPAPARARPSGGPGPSDAYRAEFDAAARSLPDATRPPANPYRLDIDALRPVYVDDDAPRVRDDGRGFDESLRYCLEMPLRGSGVAYYAMFGGALTISAVLMLGAAVVGFLGSMPAQILSLIARIAGAVALGATVSMAQRLVTIGLYTSIQGLYEMPFERRLRLSPGDGAMLLFLLLFAFVPARSIELYLPPPFGQLLSAMLLALPAYVWPALMLVTCKSDAPFAAFDVAAVRDTIRLAGKRYPVMVAVMWASAAFGWLVWFGIGYLVPDSLFGILALAILAGAPIGYAHAVLGAMLGRLIRDVPAIGLPEIVFVDDDAPAEQGPNVAGMQRTQ